MQNILLMPPLCLLLSKIKNESGKALNNDHSLISKWALNWKMLFNPYPKCHEVCFKEKESIDSSTHKS